MKAPMKAVVIHAQGGPDVLQYEDMPIPEPASDELLIRVHAAGVNPVDWKIREGHLGRIPLPSIMGSDFSGVVEALGSAVEGFRQGEPVFGIVGEESGSYAQYAVTPASRVAKKPAALDPIKAAALPIASLTAWQALFDTAALKPGQRVLIHAAAGGVGGFAVQFAKWKGAYVIGTASAQNLEFVRGLGAHEVIDYHSQRIEETVRDVDVVFDTVGGETQERSRKVLKPGGILVSIVQPPSQEAAAAHGVRGAFLVSKPKGDQLGRIAELVVSGIVKVFVEAVFPLEEARKAQELSQQGHTRGKIVLKVA